MPRAGALAPAASDTPPQDLGFTINGSDRTVRDVLVRWARQASWTHGPAHWTVNKDHPIEGTAGAEVFGDEFKKAVRVLVSTTELTDQAVQPCFYTNKVLRIIPAVASCELTE